MHTGNSSVFTSVRQERSEKVTALLLLLLFESSLDDSDVLALLAGARRAEPHKQRCTPWLNVQKK